MKKYKNIKKVINNMLDRIDILEEGKAAEVLKLLDAVDKDNKLAEPYIKDDFLYYQNNKTLLTELKDFSHRVHKVTLLFKDTTEEIFPTKNISENTILRKLLQDYLDTSKLKNGTIEQQILVVGDWYIDVDFLVQSATHLKDPYWEESCYNRFETEEKAQAAANRINALLKLQRIADVLNEGWIPDWTNGGIGKYGLYYHNKRQWDVTQFVHCSYPGQVYFKSTELAKEAIKLMGKDLDYL